MDLHSILDDALNHFDEDEETPSIPAAGQSRAVTDRSTVNEASTSRSVSKGKPVKGLNFDPLGKQKAKKSGSSPSPTIPVLPVPPGPGSDLPPFPEDVESLAGDLMKLVEEWQQMLGSEGGVAGSEAPGERGGGSHVLRALAEQTQRTVEAQEQLQGGPALNLPPGLDGLADLLPMLSGSSGAADAGPPADMGQLVDSIMKRLVSKRVLYGPMKEIKQHYPSWLSRNADNLVAADLQRYRQQYHCMEELCHLYETDPENFPKIMEKLQDMQECGSPPQEIVDLVSNQLHSDDDNEDHGEGPAGEEGPLDVLGRLGGLPGGLQGNDACKMQ